MSTGLLGFISENIKFNKRPLTADASDRFLWRASLLVFLIARTTKKKNASLNKISLLNWAFLSDENMSHLKNILEANDKLVLASISYDPSVVRILQYLQGCNLLEISGGKCRLSDDGFAIANQIDSDSGLFLAEKAALKDLDNKLFSEKNIEKIFRNG